MEVEAEEIVRIRRVSRRSISLETPVGEDHSSELGDFIADEESESPHDLAKSSLLKARMREALNGLPERERMVLEYRFGLTGGQDRKSTRLNSSHANISYAVFCLKKKKKKRLM